jgi:hypothetical protein
MNEQPVATCESQDSVGQIEQVLLRRLNGRVWNLKLKVQDILLSKAVDRAHFFDTVYVRIRTLAARAIELRPWQFCSYRSIASRHHDCLQRLPR